MSGRRKEGVFSHSTLLITVEPFLATFPFLPALLLLLPFAGAAVPGAGKRPWSTAFLRRRFRWLVIDVALTEPPVVRSVCGKPSEFLDGRWDCSPKAAATASQLGCTFSTARMVRNSFASFSAVQSMAFWPVGILRCRLDGCAW